MALAGPRAREVDPWIESVEPARLALWRDGGPETGEEQR